MSSPVPGCHRLSPGEMGCMAGVADGAAGPSCASAVADHTLADDLVDPDPAPAAEPPPGCSALPTSLFPER
jgi:hypothetical protein